MGADLLSSLSLCGVAGMRHGSHPRPKQAQQRQQRQQRQQQMLNLWDSAHGGLTSSRQLQQAGVGLQQQQHPRMGLWQLQQQPAVT
jgi:hypothetical protein